MHEHKININLLCASRFRFSLCLLPWSSMTRWASDLTIIPSDSGVFCWEFWKCFENHSDLVSWLIIVVLHWNLFNVTLFSRRNSQSMIWRFRKSLAYTNRGCIKIYARLWFRLESTESTVQLRYFSQHVWIWGSGTFYMATIHTYCTIYFSIFKESWVIDLAMTIKNR